MRLYLLCLLMSVFSVAAHAAIVQQEMRPGIPANAEYLIGQRSKPAVLLLHGFLQTREFPTVATLARGLQDAGYAVLLPTLSLNIPNRMRSGTQTQHGGRRGRDRALGGLAEGARPSLHRTGRSQFRQFAVAGVSEYASGPGDQGLHRRLAGRSPDRHRIAPGPDCPAGSPDTEPTTNPGHPAPVILPEIHLDARRPVVVCALGPASPADRVEAGTDQRTTHHGRCRRHAGTGLAQGFAAYPGSPGDRARRQPFHGWRA